MATEDVGCARVTGTVAGEPQRDAAPSPVRDESEREVDVTAQVGRQAPEFTAPAYHNGAFTTVKLSDYAGKWLMLCFYPGDFTFV